MCWFTPVFHRFYFQPKISIMEGLAVSRAIYVTDKLIKLFMFNQLWILNPGRGIRWSALLFGLFTPGLKTHRWEIYRYITDTGSCFLEVIAVQREVGQEHSSKFFKDIALPLSSVDSFHAIADTNLGCDFRCPKGRKLHTTAIFSSSQEPTRIGLGSTLCTLIIDFY